MDSLKSWYLDMLGVVRYVSRDTVLVSRPDEEADEEETAKPARSTVSSILSETEKKPAAAKPESAVAIESAEESQDQAVTFRFAFWQPSQRMVVFSEVPDTARIADSHLQMLSNLLKALGQLEAPLGACELIEWPQSRTAATDRKGAREFLDMFLQVKSKLQPFSTVLLMGQATARIIGGIESAVGARIALPWNAEGLVTHSLHEMAADPQLKRPTWEAIRHLAQDR